MHAKLMGNSRKNVRQAYRQLERAEKCLSHFIMQENSSVKVVKEKNDECKRMQGNSRNGIIQ